MAENLTTEKPQALPDAKKAIILLGIWNKKKIRNYSLKCSYFRSNLGCRRIKTVLYHSQRRFVVNIEKSR